MKQKTSFSFTHNLASLECAPKYLFYVAGLVVVIVVILMRFALICNLPYTDEGFYALHAMLHYDFLSSGKGLPPFGTLQLYSLLVAWVFQWEINHLLALRFIDMVVAIALTWAYYCLFVYIVKDVIYGAAIALILAVSMNLHLFIQNGFKNAIPIASLFLLIALYNGLKINKNNFAKCFFCGSFVALGILFREAFMPFAVIGFLAFFIAFGIRATLAYTLGGLFTSVFIVGAIAMMRGGLENIFEAYILFGKMAVESGKLTSNSFLWLSLTMQEVFFLAPSCVLIALGVILGTYYKLISFRQLFLWVSITLAPLLEIFTKGGYGYHYATCIPGILGLLAYLVAQHRPHAPRAVSIVFSLSFILSVAMAWTNFYPLMKPAFKNIQIFSEMLSQQKWPKEVLHKSNYLLMAEAVDAVSKKGDTLEISGISHLIHPLTGLRPPLWKGNHTFDRGMYALAKDINGEELARQILSNESADIVFVSDRPGFGAERLKDAIKLIPKYKLKATIQENTKNDYGLFTGKIYVKRDH